MDETTNIPTEEEVVEGTEIVPEMPATDDDADMPEESTQ